MSNPISPVSNARLNASPLSSNRKASAGTPTATRNPLFLRIYKVLGANFDDPSTREAFETLVEYYPPETEPNVAAKYDVSKGVPDVDSSSDAEDECDPWAIKWPVKVQPLTAVGPGVNTTAARARQNLQRDVEGRLADGGKKFLEAFAEVDKACNI